jgi:plasmid rolling circle replication initiator protein Rep
LNTSITSSHLNTQTTLVDLSDRDRAWNIHKSRAMKIEGHYRSFPKDRAYAERMSVCSLLLEFRQVPSDEELRLKLSGARFCRVRWCPVCQWRRSLMWKAKALKILPLVLEVYPTYRWLFVTLTIKSCEITELRSTLDHLNKSFKRFSDLKDFPAEGWLKAFEVTRGKDGSAHPHFHILMMVKSTYFNRGYLSLEEWRSMWQKSLRVDYRVQIDVKALDKNHPNFVALLAEVIKYQVKESDLINDKDWFLELTKQMHNTRSISSGGILKEYLKELETEPEDLIGELEGEEGETLARLYFAWQKHCQQYVLVP